MKAYRARSYTIASALLLLLPREQAVPLLLNFFTGEKAHLLPLQAWEELLAGEGRLLRQYAPQPPSWWLPLWQDAPPPKKV